MHFVPRAHAGAAVLCPDADASRRLAIQRTLQELKDEVHELKDMVFQLQQQTVASRNEITHLREELEKGHGSSGSSQSVTVDEQSPAYGTATTAQLEQRLDSVEEQQQLLTGKIDDQYQTKVESASKYRVRLSGIVLFNLFGNSGSVDNLDVPTWAQPGTPGVPSGAAGGTLRQSIIGLEAFGPDLWGAHTSANVNFDFGGGFPATTNGVDSGLVRLRTAAVRLDWKDTSVVAGQDQLFISPLSPTSFASLIVPPLSYAGDLWAWTPQLRVEHHFALSSDSTVLLQGGFIDNLTGEPPDGPYYSWYRVCDLGRANPAAGVCGASRLFSSILRADLHGWGCGLLQPSELGLRPHRERLGGHDGSQPAAGQPVRADWFVLSRRGDWRIGRGAGPQRCL